MRMMHLNKGGTGFAFKTACGRNLLRTPMSTEYASFIALPQEQQCEKCRVSKQALFMAKLAKLASK